MNPFEPDSASDDAEGTLTIGLSNDREVDLYALACFGEEGGAVPYVPDLNYIGRILEGTPRYGRHSAARLNVASHCVRVGRIAECIARGDLSIPSIPRPRFDSDEEGRRRFLAGLELFALLHDVEEALLGDVTSPLGRVLTVNTPWGPTPWDKFKDSVRLGVQAAVLRAELAGRRAPHAAMVSEIANRPDVHHIIREADALDLAWEVASGWVSEAAKSWPCVASRAHRIGQFHTSRGMGRQEGEGEWPALVVSAIDRLVT